MVNKSLFHLRVSVWQKVFAFSHCFNGRGRRRNTIHLERKRHEPTINAFANDFDFDSLSLSLSLSFVHLSSFDVSLHLLTFQWNCNPKR